MKTILSSRRDHYLVKFSIFLIAVALIAGMVGCDVPQYHLTILISTEGGEVGGEVTTPGEGTFSYDEGEVVNLTAEAKEGYRFVEWTGLHVATIADVNAANTTITMYNHYSIKAHFVWGQEIRDWYGLNATRTPNNLGGNHILMNDLDSNTLGHNKTASEAANEGKGWKPIVTFNGTFDGKGYEIRDLSINRTDEDGVGLFGDVDGGVVRNVRVVNATVTGERNVGVLVGWNEGTVSNSYSTGSVTGNQSVGGLVGWNGGTVRDSYSSSNVTGSNQYVGGLVGWNQGTVSKSYSSSNVTGSNDYVGGLVGWNQHTVSSSNSTGSVSGDIYVGGLVGWNEGTVSSSNSTGNVKGNDNVGGLVGYNYLRSTVKESHSTGSVNGSNQHVGGLAGWNEGTVEKCYSSSTVSGSLCVGGLVGGNEHEGIVRDSYSTGSVSGTTGVGGLVGHNLDEVSNSYSSSNVIGHTHVGGLVGQNEGTVAESYSAGSVTGSSHSTRVGGLVGYNKGSKTKVSDSYSTGSVAGNQYVGGLVGYNDQGTVENSYSKGSVTGFSQVGIGGLVGWKTRGEVSDSFWDKETSGTGLSPGGGMGLTTADMQTFATFDNAGWSICEAPTNDTCTWYITSGEYPRHEQPV